MILIPSILREIRTSLQHARFFIISLISRKMDGISVIYPTGVANNFITARIFITARFFYQLIKI
jgi:hypothetical protein